MRRALLIALSLGAALPAAAVTAPPVIRTTAPPAEIALGAGGMWVVEDGAPRTLRLFDTSTGAPIGTPVPLDDGTPVAGFGTPVVACCDVPHPLVVHAGSAWTVAEGGRIIRGTRSGSAVVDASVQLQGIARDVVAGRTGLHALEVHVPGGTPWAGDRIGTIDTAANTVTTGPLLDVPGPTGSTFFEGRGPLQMAAGNPGVFWLTKASVAMSTLRADRIPATGTRTGIPAGRLIARARGVTWLKSIYNCDITRISPEGRVRRIANRWDAPSRGGCRLRRIVADGRGDLWAIGGRLRPGRRGVVFRIDGDTGRLLGRPVSVGTDPWMLAPTGTGTWVGDRTSRTIRFVARR